MQGNQKDRSEQSGLTSAGDILPRVRGGRPRRRPTVCLDFDGVIHAGPWAGRPDVIAGELVHGALEAIERLRRSCNVVVNSARSATPEGRAAIHRWLAQHGLRLEVTVGKPVADVYVDDKGIRFEAWPDSLRGIARALRQAGKL